MNVLLVVVQAADDIPLDASLNTMGMAQCVTHKFLSGLLASDKIFLIAKTTC